MADRAIAALSADPVTLAELDAAYARFRKRTPGRSFFGNLSAGFSDEPYDAGIVVIDLVARLIFVDSTYSSAGPEGRVRYHNGHCATDTSLPYHLAGDGGSLAKAMTGRGWRNSDAGNWPPALFSRPGACFTDVRYWSSLPGKPSRPKLVARRLLLKTETRSKKFTRPGC